MAYNRTIQHFTSSQELATIWASGQNYIVNQLVLDSDKLYRCNTAHTSGATFAGDSAYWTGLNQGGIIDIAGGGTGQTTATAAFDALAPTTTAGDLIVYNGTDNIRLPVGTDGQMIVADASQTNKLKWATVPQGSKNYITYSNFENNATTGWSLFNTTLTSKIPTGSIGAGAASLNALAVTAVTPLAGLYSLSVTSPAAVSAGQGFITSALPIDREDQAKVLTFSFYYEVVSGGSNMNFSGTSSNTWAVYIAEVNPATPDTVINWIQPAGVYGMTQSTGAGLVTGTFQTSSTGTAYRVAVVCVTASAGAISMEFDDFKLGPQTAPIGPVMSDWISYTPTITHGSGSMTNATASGRYRRVGDSIEVYGTITFSAASAAFTEVFASLPAGLTFDTTKLSSTGSLVPVLGTAFCFDTGFTVYGTGNVLYRTSTAVDIRYPITTVGANPVSVATNVISNASPFTFNAGDSISWHYMAPISGWSSNVQLSNDTDTRVVAARAASSNTTLYAQNALNQMIFTTPSFDTHGTWIGNEYRIPVSGYYQINGRITVNNTLNGNTAFIYVYRDGVFYSTLARGTNYISALAVNCVGSDTYYFNAGAVLTFFWQYTADNAGNRGLSGDVNNNYISIQRLSGPSVVAASESVTASYHSNNSGQALTSAAYVPFIPSTKVWDSHNAFNTSTGEFSAPIGGEYQIDSFFVLAPKARTIGQALFIGIYVDGSMVKSIGGNRANATNVLTMEICGVGSVKVNAGQKIVLRLYVDATGEALFTGASPAGQFNWVTFKRVGN